jgi:hypothetical protein
MHSVCVCVCEMHQNLKLLAAALPEEKDYRFLFENLVCFRQSQNCIPHRCSNCPGQSQLQTVTEELFQTNDFDVEDSVVYKWCFHDGHTKIVSMTSTVGEFTVKICWTADHAATHHYTTKSQASYLKMLKETILPDNEAVILLDFSKNYSFYVRMPYKGSTGKLIRPLSILL